MDNRTHFVISIVQIAGVCILLCFLFTLPKQWDLQREVGTALVLVGVLGLALARYQLGRSFAIRAEAHKLVTQGIYSKIRNPIYFSGTILVSGLVLIIHRPVGWLLVLAIIVMQTIRAHREARVLEAAFGEAYREYRRKTWF